MDAAVQHWTEAEKANISASLANMLASPLFAGSPRQQRFLIYLVTHTLAGEADRLKGYTIALEVFDRKDDFDPSLDAIVRVEATRLRNKLREYYDTLGKSDAVILRTAYPLVMPPNSSDFSVDRPKERTFRVCVLANTSKGKFVTFDGIRRIRPMATRITCKIARTALYLVSMLS